MATAHALLPFGDPSRGRRLVKVLAWLAGIACGRRARAARHRRRRLVLEPVGRPHAASGSGTSLAGWSLQTVQTTLTALGWYFILRAALSGRAAALPPGARGIRGGRRAERVPARQHRDVRDAADVRRDHPRRQLPGRARRDARAEDLLHGRRRVRLRLPVRVRAGHVRAPARAAARPSRPDATSSPAPCCCSRPRAHLPAQAAGLWAKAKQGGAILAGRATTCSSRCCRRSAPGSPSSA